MDPIEKYYNDCKAIYQIESNWRSKIESRKSQILIESRELESMQNNYRNLEERNNAIQDQISALKEHNEDIERFRDESIESVLMKQIFEKVVENLEPTTITLGRKFNDITTDYKKLKGQFENSPEFQKILSANMEEKRLSDMITELRNKLMRMETQKDFQ